MARRNAFGEKRKGVGGAGTPAVLGPPGCESRRGGRRPDTMQKEKAAPGMDAVGREPGSPPLVIGHRGAAAEAPENTAASFRRALSLGVDGLEMDVHLSRDGELVVIHDERVDRTSDGQGWVKDLTLAELKRLDFGAWFGPQFRGERILTLAEFLTLVQEEASPAQRERFLINIELKSGPILYPGIEEKVIRAIYEFHIQDRVILSSFNHYSLQTVKKLAPELPIGLLYMAGLVEPWHYALRLQAQALHPLYFNIIPELVAGAHAHGLKLHPFTVDDEPAMRLMVQLGVDGIITNRPADLLRVLGRDSRG